MTPQLSLDEITAVREARQIVHDSPKEAPALLEGLIEGYRADGKVACALEVRRIQCFALISNIEFEAAEVKLNDLLNEAIEANERRFFGVVEMYRGLIWLNQGQCNLAVEYFDRAIQVGTELEDLDLIYRVQVNLAFAQSMLEKYEESLETLKQCVRYIEPGNPQGSDGTKLYNVAAARVNIAFQAYDRGELTQEHLDLVRHDLRLASRHCETDVHLTMLLAISRALFVGLDEGFEQGIEALRKLRPQVESSVAVHLITYQLAESRILESAKRWQELCSVSSDLVARMKGSRWMSAIQIALRRAAKAHAENQEFEAAYHYLHEWLVIENRFPTDQRAEMASLRLDLQRQRFDQDVLRMRNRTLVERNKILEQEARFDPLSGILNRRGTEEALRECTDRRFADRFVIVLLDIDHFKKINDRFGHAVGDQVIHEFAACLINSATKPAKLGRWGGEEFLIVYDANTPDEMANLGETLVSEIRSLDWSHIHPELKVSASCGLSMWLRGNSLDEAIRIADDMLYEVKHHGRDNWRIAA